MNLMWMVKAKNIEIGNFQKITKNVDIKNINELKILYMEVNKVDNLLRQFEKVDEKKNNLKELYLYFKKSDDVVLFKISNIFRN